MMVMKNYYWPGHSVVDAENSDSVRGRDQGKRILAKYSLFSWKLLQEDYFINKFN
jgi:hypothetical protein